VAISKVPKDIVVPVAKKSLLNILFCKNIHISKPWIKYSGGVFEIDIVYLKKNSFIE
jgi:hypothetical protein